MSEQVEIRVPDIGDFDDVPVIEILVAPGDEVAAEQSLVTLESDKATMEVPSPAAAKIVSVNVSLNQTVSQGDVVAVIEAVEPAGAGAAVTDEPAPETTIAAESREPDASGSIEADFDLLVLGAGPGGYTAAFRAADLGLRVALVERYPELGGVCLNVGCIPSKTLLHAAAVIDEAAQISKHGVKFGPPEIELDALRGWKNKVVSQLTGGLAGMAGKRRVTVLEANGRFSGPHEMELETAQGLETVSFSKAIIAAGSQALHLPGFPWDDPRVMDSTDALLLKDIPSRLLVVGGGIIGLEMASVYQALGSAVTVVELTSQLMPGADPDLVRPLHKHVAARYAGIHLGTRVTGVQPGPEGLAVSFEGEDIPEDPIFDRILVSVGRTPNGHAVAVEKAGVEVTEQGFIPVDRQMRTNVGHIFAIGDIVGQPMLAHKATHEGKVAAEVCAGRKTAFEARVIPSVAYTDPEVAWAGLTETQAKQASIPYKVGKFPWAASGRALGIGRPEGFTKLLFDPESARVIGAGIVGPHAGDLIAECALAIEMGAEAGDIGLTIHPHPTLSESIAMAAEVFEGTITDLYLPKRR